MGPASRIGAALSSGAKRSGRAAGGFLFGLSCPFRGLVLVYFRRPALLRFAVGPILLTLAGLVLATWFAWAHGHDLVVWAWAPPVGEEWWHGVLRALHWVVTFLARLVAWLFGVFVVLFVLLGPLASPFNDALSAAVERVVRGDVANGGGLAKIARDAGRTVLFETAKLAVKVGIGATLFVVGLILPFLAPLSTVVGVLFAVSYPALDYTDWPMARRDLGIRARLRFFRQNLPTMLGFGAAVWAMLLIPGVNLLFMPAAAAGGTLLFLGLAEPAPPVVVDGTDTV